MKENNIIEAEGRKTSCRCVCAAKRQRSVPGVQKHNKQAFFFCRYLAADSRCTVTAPPASPFSNRIHLCEGWISIREKALSLPLWNLAKKQFITSGSRSRQKIHQGEEAERTKVMMQKVRFKSFRANRC